MSVDRQCKIVILGHGSVGKSSLINRFRSEGFAPKYHQTVGVDFFEKRLELRGAQAVKLQIWDIGGQRAPARDFARCPKQNGDAPHPTRGEERAPGPSRPRCCPSTCPRPRSSWSSTT